jgi:hypothetical protein
MRNELHHERSMSVGFNRTTGITVFSPEEANWNGINFKCKGVLKLLV